MKKIYSYVLMVTALLIGTNAWGTIYTIGQDDDPSTTFDYETLKEAFASTDWQSGDTLRLETNIETEECAWFGTQTATEDGKTLTLDLNGKTYLFRSNKSWYQAIAFTHGKLTVMTSQPGGKIAHSYNWVGNYTEDNAYKGGASIISVYGTYQKDDVKYDGRQTADTYTHLIIEHGVLIDANDGVAGIIVDVLRPDMYKASAGEYAWPGYDDAGMITYRTDLSYRGSSMGYANGVRVDIHGKIESYKYGMKINGKMRNPLENFTYDAENKEYKEPVIHNPMTSGWSAMYGRTWVPNSYEYDLNDMNYMPYIYLHKDGEIVANASYTGAAGIYASGASRWRIEGRCSGSTGLYAKSGTIEIVDAIIESTNTTHTAPEDNNQLTLASGINAGGSAIVVKSEDAYTGFIDITISGDSKISATSGYAIEEDHKEGTDKLETISIEGGTIEGGDCGAIAVTGTGATKTTILGASVATTSTEDKLVVIDGQAADLSDVVDENTHLTPVTVAGKTTFVVTQGEDPEDVAPANPADVNAKYTIQNTTETWVNWTGTVDQEINANKTLDYLEMNLMVDDDNDPSTPKVAAEQKLTVKDGDTLTVGRVILGEKAKIIVEAGGNFIVNGSQGIIAPKVANIELQSSEAKQAYFLFNPSVTSNKYPNATVAFESKAFQDGSKWVYQRFGVPTWDREGTNTNPKHYNTAMKSMHTDYGDSWVAEFDYSTGHWGAWGSFTEANYTIEDALPFRGYMLASNNAKANKMEYEFAGQLIGNQNENLHMYNGWNYFANSYTAPVDIKEFINTVIATLGEENKNKILATVYLYMDSGNDDYIWYGVNKTNAGDDGFMIVGEDIQPFKIPTTILPMQAFLLRLNAVGETDQAINYQRNVYNPYMNIPNAPITAPARMAQTDNEMQVLVSGNGSWDKVQIIENDNFSDEMDNGYDAYKYNEGKGVSLYALNGEANMDIFATDDAEGTFIGIDAKQAGNYTMHIEGVEGMEYAIVDMQTNAVINAVNGMKYQFYTAAGKNDYRFQIVSASKVVTDIDNVEIKENVKGVYTITGQYLGENVNALPSGLYIINGVKVVK